MKKDRNRETYYSKGNFFINYCNEESLIMMSKVYPKLVLLIKSLNREVKCTYFEKIISYSDLLPSCKKNMYRDIRGYNAHQSNIGLGKFISILGFAIPNRRKGATSSCPIERVTINTKYKVYLITDCLKHFNNKSTNKIHFLKNTQSNIKLKNDINIMDNEFLEMKITIASHGIGIKDDQVFNTLRQNFFLEDKIIMFLIRDKTENYLFVTAEKNQKFYEIIYHSNNMNTGLADSEDNTKIDLNIKKSKESITSLIDMINDGKLTL